jgi:hypothetical protein
LKKKRRVLEKKRRNYRMLAIDFLAEVGPSTDEPDEPIIGMFPCQHEATNFLILPVEHKDNEGNEELSPHLRYEVTRVTYSIWATVIIHTSFVDMFIKQYDTEAEAVKVYDEVMDAIARGDKLYSFRRS